MSDDAEKRFRAAEHSTMDAKDAVLWWKMNYRGDVAPRIAVGRLGQVPSWASDQESGLSGSYGACNVEYLREYCNEQRVRALLEFGLDMIVNQGYDAATVIRELCKVRQFYDIGADSQPMRSAISGALCGTARSDWPPFSGEQ